MASSDGLHIVTYDVRGTVRETGQPKPFRQTGIVTHTHQLLTGLARRRPGMPIAITHTGAASNTGYHLTTPQGQHVFVQGIRSDFPQLLRRGGRAGKDRSLVRHYYEDRINDVDNPVYASLARQYAHVVRQANMPNLLLQNPNPTVSLLKAEELGFLDELTCGQLNVTAVIHDVASYEARLGYVRDRLATTRTNFKILAISRGVRDMLDQLAPPAGFTVSNGLDVSRFQQKVSADTMPAAFDRIRERNQLPPTGRMVLVAARRAEHKGHLDVIRAMRMLRDHGRADGVYAAFTGKDMLDTRSLAHEEVLAREITAHGLEDRVFMLDALDADEVVACYRAAHVAVLASTEPEGFGYSNVEAMLAGVPVITTPLGGPLDYVDDGVTGLFVAPHDPAGLAHALDRVLTEPGLHGHLAEHGRRRAQQFTIEAMTDGYLDAISAGRQRLSLRVTPRREFQKVGEGMHTEVFRSPSGRSALQLFRPGSDKLNAQKVVREYTYLIAAYAAMPGLIPRQRLFEPQPGAPLSDMILVKEFIDIDTAQPLRRLPTDPLPEPARSQLRQFIAITRELFTRTPADPRLRDHGPGIPDFIDPAFANLVVDRAGQLRLVDTNMLINTRSLGDLVRSGRTLDIGERPIHALALRRLMYLEATHLHRTAEELMADPFYVQYLSPADFMTLFRQSAQAGEPIRPEDIAVVVAGSSGLHAATTADPSSPTRSAPPTGTAAGLAQQAEHPGPGTARPPSQAPPTGPVTAAQLARQDSAVRGQPAPPAGPGAPRRPGVPPPPPQHRRGRHA